MALVNSHFTEGRVRPNVPALVEIGGIQINPVTQKLPTVNLFDFILCICAILMIILFL